MKFIIIFCFFVLAAGCSSQKAAFSNHRFISDEIVLVKTVPGGSRAHIFILDTAGRLTYRIGEFYKSNPLTAGSFKFDPKYKDVVVNLTEDQLRSLGKGIKRIESRFIDKLSIKDDLENYIYVGGSERAFFYQYSLRNIPKYLSYIEAEIVKAVGTLYELPGMA